MKARDTWGLLLSSLPWLVSLALGGWLLGKEQAMLIVGWVLVISGALGLIGWVLNLVSAVKRR